MCKKPVLLLLFLLFLCSQFSFSQSCTNGLTGTYKIGPTGQFSSIGAAWDTLKLKGVAGPLVLELQASYASTVEIFPLKLTRINCADTLRPITLRPENGATGLVIGSAHDTTTLELSSVNGLIIDGRPGGTGTAIQLKISNSSVSGNALRFLHGARYTTLRYTEFTGSVTNPFNGVINMGWSDSLTGNLNNLIEYCNIHSGTLPAANLIWAQGYAARKNRNFMIRNSRLYDFYLRNASSSAIHIANANDSVEISGNQIYQTTPRDYASSGAFNMVSGIRVNTIGEGNHQIKNNTIGGSAPGATGAKMRLTGSYNFKGIYIYCATGSTRASLVENNLITNLYFEVNDGINLGLSMIHLGYSELSAIYSFNGFCRGNTVGSTDTSQAIIHRSLRTLTSQTYLTGIDAAGLSSNDSSCIINNKVGGLLVQETSTGRVHVNGIWLGGNSAFGSFRCLTQNNLIGSTTNLYNIWNRSGFYVYGIYQNGAANNANMIIRQNTIANLTASAPTSTTGFGSIMGILLLNGYSAGTLTIDKNKIYNLTAGRVTNPDANYSLGGIYITLSNSQPSHLLISGNEIHSLFTENSLNSSQFQVAGIHLKSNYAARLNTIVSSNRIHSISGLPATPPLFAPRYSGILLDMDTLSVQLNNNMISLGMYGRNMQLDDNGQYYGIQEYFAGRTVLLHNTVYIAGRSSGTESAAYATFSNADTKRFLYNNLMVNLRTNKSDAAKVHAVLAFYPRTTGTPTYYSDHNAYFVSASNGKIGNYGTNSAITTLSNWQTITARDSSTIYGDPNFSNDTTGLTLPDLHIQSPTIIEGRGNTLLTLATDFDGDSRPALSPVDIGADAGNFLAMEPQKAAAGLNFTSITNTSATITVTPGDGTNRLFVIRSGAAVNANPVDAQGYVANSQFGSGGTMGSSNFVIGDANQSVTVTGLAAGTTYHVSVFEFNGRNTSANYLTTNTPSSSFTTTGVTGIINLNTTEYSAKLFPNPGKQFFLEITSPKAIMGEYEITGMNGQRILSGRKMMKPGMNRIEITSLDHMAAGNYVLHLKVDRFQGAILLVKQ